MYKKPIDLEPMSGQETVNKMVDYFLGPNWHADDGLTNVKEVNAVAFENIVYTIENEFERIRHSSLVGICICSTISIIIGIIIGIYIGGIIQ